MALGVKRRFAVAWIAAAAIVVALAGCGSGGSSSSDSTFNSSKTDVSKGKTSASSKSEPSSEFGGVLAKFGKEAGATEREAASAVVEESLQARAEGDWAGQCSTLVAPLIQKVEEAGSTLGAGAGCTKALEAQAAPTPPSARANPMTGPIDTLRVRGVRAFALFHGAKNKNFVIPLIKESGDWKVASLETQEVP